MAENTPIIVYTAECIGNAANCLYPNEVKITDELSAKLAFSTDMVCARYKNNYRNTANFEVATALPGDCDFIASNFFEVFEFLLGYATNTLSFTQQDRGSLINIAPRGRITKMII